MAAAGDVSGGGGHEWPLGGPRWGDGAVSELDGGGGCTALWTQEMSPNDSLKTVFMLFEFYIWEKPHNIYLVLLLIFFFNYEVSRASPVAQTVKRLSAMQERWVRSPGGEDPLEKGMATHCSILAWEISWTEEPGGLQSTGSQRA